jgi:hypothetical protein
MGNRPLGPKWIRRITQATGLTIVHASGCGGYWHSFTTVDHQHGVIHAKTLEWRLAAPPMHGSSCHRLFPHEYEPRV